MSRKGENIYKRKDGRWEARYIKDRDFKGKAIYGYIYAKTYKEAREKKQLLSKQGIKQNKKILFNTVIDEWLLERKNRIKESTYVIYYLDINNHIKPYFQTIYIDEINNLVINEFVKEKLSKGRLDNKGGLSNKTVKELLNIINSCIDYAVYKKYILLSLSKVNIPKKHMRKSILNNEELNKLIHYLKENNNAVNIGILLMICTGMRIGELCALKNKDIDLNKGIINVNKTLQRITNIENKKTKIIITNTKTDKSERVIPIPNSLIEYLKIDYNDLYFLTQTYKYMEPRTFRYAFKRKIKKLHLPEVTVHSLRHSFATKCIELGFDYNCLSEILGHSSPSTTMNLYVHSKIEYKKECMNKIQI